MRVFNLVALAMIDLGLIIRLSLNSDLSLGFLIAISQVLILTILMGFGTQSTARERAITKKEIGAFCLLVLLIVPVFVFHESKFEKSSWSEVGLLIRGPSAFVFIFMAMISVLGAATASLYIRGKK